jgi:hypothetical protein
MNVRWMAVLTGVVVDIVIGTLLALIVGQDVLLSPDLSRPGDVILFCLPIVLTTVSGYVAGRMAKESRVLNGLLVQIIGILFSMLGPPLPRIQVIAYAVSCAFAALGGYLSRYPAQPISRSPGQR